MSSDLPERLRKATGLDLDLKREAADEIERLLSRTGTDSRQTCDEAAECHSDGVKCPERDHLTDEERHCLTQVLAINKSKCLAPLRGLLDRLGGCTQQLDCWADRKSVASERCCIAGGQPFESAPITLTDAERLA